MNESRAQSVLEQVAQAVAAVLPKELAEDVRNNVKASIKSALDKLDLVTREELEVQETVLARTRAKVEALEKQLKDLETRISDRA